MNNFFSDNDELLLCLDALKGDAHTSDDLDAYRHALEFVGELAAQQLAPKAEEVDAHGAALQRGAVTLPISHLSALHMLGEQGLAAPMLSKAFGGQAMPATVAAMMVEIMARADASFLAAFLQQDVAAAIERFAADEIKRAYLPRIARGELTCAMALTEANAGSDLKSVALEAIEPSDGAKRSDGAWRLRGRKRFISNGCAGLLLVLARSEPGTESAKGLSLFLCQTDQRLRVLNAENKMGLRGSPTCELSFDDVPATLIGQRKRGLSKYTLWLISLARLHVAAQSIGIAEAAFREAEHFASRRMQFGEPVREKPQVLRLLTNMRTAIEGARSLCYEAARLFDRAAALEKHAERSAEQEKELAACEELLELMIPMAKARASEMANAVAYDAVQISGGRGVLKGAPVERLFRDARVTTIYEGTSQLQVAAVLRGMANGKVSRLLRLYNDTPNNTADSLAVKCTDAISAFDRALETLAAEGDAQSLEWHARPLVDAAADILTALLLTHRAKRNQRKQARAQSQAFIQQRFPCVLAQLAAIAGKTALSEQVARTLLDEERVFKNANVSA